MKTTKFNKLTLNKHTVANLSNKELVAVKGGDTEDCTNLKSFIVNNCMYYLPDWRLHFTCSLTSNDLRFDLRYRLNTQR